MTIFSMAYHKMKPNLRDPSALFGSQSLIYEGIEFINVQMGKFNMGLPEVATVSPDELTIRWIPVWMLLP